MVKAFATGLFLLLFVSFAIYAPLNHGWAGVVATILWTLIMLLGLGGALMGNGLLGGLVGVVVGWVAFVIITTAMALIEWYNVGNRPSSELITDEFCKECLGGRVIAATSGYIMWVYEICTTEHPMFNTYMLVCCIVLTLVCFVGHKLAKS